MITPKPSKSPQGMAIGILRDAYEARLEEIATMQELVRKLLKEDPKSDVSSIRRDIKMFRADVKDIDHAIRKLGRKP